MSLASSDAVLVDATTPTGVLWALRGDAGLRALTAWNLGWREAQATAGTRWMPRVIGELLNDPYPAVRVVAGRTLSQFPGYDDLAYDSEATPGERLEVRAESAVAGARPSQSRRTRRDRASTP